MKKENGSALLTVILIVFVTATIGSAITSFIMMNYKLKNLDNRISRAEYEAEKKMDNLYAQVQKALDYTIGNSVTEAIEKIDGEVSLQEENLKNGIGNSYRYVYKEGESLFTNRENIVEDQKKEYEKLILNFVDNLEQQLLVTYNEMQEGLKATKGVKLLNSSDEFGNSNASAEVKLEDDNFSSNNIVKVILYYEGKNVPAVKIKVDFVIGFPSFENAEGYNYNLNDLINLTNWEMETEDV